MRNKFFTLLVCLFVLCGLLIPASYTFASTTGITVTIDGRELIPDEPPVLEDDRVLVPLRIIGEALQAKVDWDSDTEAVKLTRRSAVVTLKMDGGEVEVNGVPIEQDIKAVLIRNRTMVPLRFIAQTFGAEVSWDGKTQTVNITTVPTGDTVTGKVDGPVRVPLLFPVEVEHKLQANEDKKVFTAGYWDLYAGEFTFDSTPAFNLQSDFSALYRMAWDGGERICFSHSLPESLVVTGVQPGFQVNVLNQTEIHSPVVYCPSGSQTAIFAQFKRDETTAETEQETGKIVVEIKQDNQVTEKRELTPPLPDDASGPYPLLVYGNPEDIKVLAAYGAPGGEGLLWANIKGEDVNWKTVEGGKYGSFIAGAGASPAKCGDRLFIDDLVLDPGKDDLKLEKYPLINNLLDTVRAKFAFLPQPLRPILNVYRDVLLVSAIGDREMWVWALQNNQCVGQLYFDKDNRRLMVYHDGELNDQRTLPAANYSFPVLPEHGFGSWW